jgi:nicotinamidase-related amidase
MPAKNLDLHGNVPDHSPVALVLIDVVNDLEFEGGGTLLPHALAMADRIAALKRRARRAGIATVYVNDNFGRWKSDFAALLAHCLEDDVAGRPVVERLRPDGDDYFVLKPKHSGFYSTALDVLLAYLGTHTLVLTGLTADRCVAFTAADAFLRDYHLYVPADCVASCTAAENRAALERLRRTCAADIRPSAQIPLARLAAGPRTARRPRRRRTRAR